MAARSPEALIAARRRDGAAAGNASSTRSAS